MLRSKHTIPALSLVALAVLSGGTSARAFSLLPEVILLTVDATFERAARWSSITGLDDGIQVGVEIGFATDLGSSGPEIALVNQAVLDAFAAWESPVLRFDVTLEAAGTTENPATGFEIDLFAAPETQVGDSFGITFTDTTSGPRLLTNGQPTGGSNIRGV